METQFDRRRRRAVGGFPWVEALRDQVPRPRRPGGDGGAFDDLARSLAEEVPRREAMRRLGVGLATAVLASLGLESAWGDPKAPKCKKGFFACADGHCCANGQQCCGSLCCPSGSACCGGACCQLGQTCCVGPSGTPHCATIGSSTDCSGCSDVCQSDETCLGAQCVCSGNRQPRCDPAPGFGFPDGQCCPSGEKCCGSGCWPDDYTCCFTGSQGPVCPPSKTCCLGPETPGSPGRIGECCESDQVCASDGSRCCLPNGTATDNFAYCCSRTCITAGGDCMCVGLSTGDPCSFNQQCASGVCRGGQCT